MVGAAADGSYRRMQTALVGEYIAADKLGAGRLRLPWIVERIEYGSNQQLS